MSKKGSLYWTPVAGNNYFRALGGNANIFSFIETGHKHEGLFEESILVDFGNIPIYTTDDIDYVVPDLDMFFPPLESDQAPKFKALLLTHYHDDHLKGVVDLLLRGRKVPPIIAPQMTFEMLDKYLADYGYQGSYPKIVAKARRPITFGKWRFESFHVSHSTAGCIGFSIEIEGHRALHMGDFKIDQTVSLGPKTDLDYLKDLGDRGAVDLLVVDSVKSKQENNFLLNDKAMKGYIDSLVKKHHEQRIVMGVYGAYLELASVTMISAAQKGRKIIIASQYMQDNIDAYEKTYGTLSVLLSEKAGVCVEIYKDTDPRVATFNPEETLVITDGNLRDKRSLLSACLNDDVRPYINLQKGDALYLSRAILQGKQEMYAPAFEKLSQDGVDIFMPNQNDVAAHGHAPWKDIKRLVEITKPRAVAPAYAMDFMLEEVFNRAAELPKESKVLSIKNGEMTEVSPATGTQVCQFLPYWIGVKYSVYGERKSRKSILGLKGKNPLKIQP